MIFALLSMTVSLASLAAGVFQILNGVSLHETGTVVLGCIHVTASFVLALVFLLATEDLARSYLHQRRRNAQR